MQDTQEPTTIWRDGTVPVSLRFDDPYYSLENGLAETQHVFLTGNALPLRFSPGFHIAELGFGTGLNLLAAWQAWRATGADSPLQFTSFEAYPLRADELARALSHFPELAELAAPLIDAWTRGETRLDTPDLRARIVIGDARETLPTWPGRADAWFLDGFSPAKNPELWEAPLMAEVARHTRPGGTVATYTAAGFVRRNLQEAGFDVSRCAGFGRKRHMTTAILP